MNPVSEKYRLPRQSPGELGVDAAGLQRAFSGITARVAQGLYPGAVAQVIKAGSVIGTHAIGKMGQNSKVTITEDALFSLESISKVICTAPLILSLHEAGVFGLDQPLADWLPMFRSAERKKITPRQVLSHTSGLAEGAAPAGGVSPAQAPLWEQILSAPLASLPGTQVSYCDLAYQVLGHAVEVATGQTLDQLAKEKLWDPLGLKNTLFNPSPSLLARCVDNRGVRGQCVDPVDRALGGVVGCDGVFSNAGDLACFAQMILNHGNWENSQILTATSVQEMVRDQTPFAKADEQIESDLSYLLAARKGLGWELPGSRFCHGGTAFSSRAFGKVGGTGTFLWVDPTHELIAIYLTNYGQPSPFDETGWARLIEATGARDFFTQVVESVRSSAK